MIAFRHDKDVDMLRLSCPLSNLANICSHKSTDSKFYPVTEGDKDLLEKNSEKFVGGPSIVFARKAVVDETFYQNLTNLCKYIADFDSSQQYPFSICPPMLNGFHTRWDLNSEAGKLTPRQNKTRSFENMVISCFQEDQNVKVEAS